MSKKLWLSFSSSIIGCLLLYLALYFISITNVIAIQMTIGIIGTSILCLTIPSLYQTKTYIIKSKQKG